MSEWISVKDRLPEVGQYVQLGNENHYFVDRGKLSSAGNWLIFRSATNAPLDRFTHWMPLPEPPEKDVGLVAARYDIKELWAAIRRLQEQMRTHTHGSSIWRRG